MKPKPAKPAATPEPPSPASSQSQGADNNHSSPGQKADANDTASSGGGEAAGEPMETDKSESAPNA